MSPRNSNGRNDHAQPTRNSMFSISPFDPIAAQRMEDLVANALSARQDFFNKLMDPRRSINDECGYPDTPPMGGIEVYRQLYDREPIANRVVQLMPRECWQTSPMVYEDESSENVTEFEEAWDALGQQLRAEKSFFQDEEGSPVWEHLKRADILSGIGHFGALLLGIDDGKNLMEPIDGVLQAIGQKDAPITKEEEDKLKNPKSNLTKNQLQAVDQWVYERDNPTPLIPAENKIKTVKEVFGTDQQYDYQPSISGTDQQYFGVQFGGSEQAADKPSGKERKLLFLRAFDESLVQIVRYEWDIRNPRFGAPNMYHITLNDPKETHSGNGLPIATVFVHWSRVIHLADNLHSSEIFGAPRMRPVLNPVLDCQKVRGAASEGYWKSCFTGLAYETHPQLGGDVQVNVPALRNMNEQYVNGLDRALFTSGMSVKTLAPSVVDPKPHLEGLIEAICIQLGCPVRVFKGSERGELASSQDDSSWNDRVAERQNNYVTPRIIVPFIDRLIIIGVLPEPEGYSIKWPDLDSTTEKEKSAILTARTQAYAAYVSGGLEAIIPPKAYMTKFDRMDEEEATSIIEEAQAAHDTADTMTMPPQVEGQPASPPEGTAAGDERQIQQDQMEQDAQQKGPPTKNEEGEWIGNVFCPGGPGAGRDPSCKKGEKQGGKGALGMESAHPPDALGSGIKRDPKTPPPPGKVYTPDVDHMNHDGITLASRVGVAGHDVPPPPPIPRLAYLTPRERAVEKAFAQSYEADPEGIAHIFRGIVKQSTKPGDAPTYGTDDAKVLSGAWSHPDPAVRSQNRATLNLALHQTANAITKRAFLQELDGLKPGDHIMVTVGGCGAGKGYALKNVPQALEMKKTAKVVWDSAGDQNATENPWIQKEAEKRGLKVNYVFVHADPQTQWAHPERGVVKRAEDPNDGRMVDAKVFADSYAIGARNHNAFYQKHRNNPAASFIFLANSGGGPKLLDGIPKEALEIDRHELVKFAIQTVNSRVGDIAPHVIRGAVMGERIWPKDIK